jgi:hypothetical protein
MPGSTPFKGGAFVLVLTPDLAAGLGFAVAERLGGDDFFCNAEGLFAFAPVPVVGLPGATAAGSNPTNISHIAIHHIAIHHFMPLT